MSDLTRFRDYCRSQAAKESDPLWRALADEVDHYLATVDRSPCEADVPLDLG